MALSLVVTLTHKYVDNFKILFYTLATTTALSHEDHLYLLAEALSPRLRQDVASYVCKHAAQLQLHFVEPTRVATGYSQLKRHFSDHPSQHLARFLLSLGSLEAQGSLLYLDLQTIVLSDLGVIENFSLGEHLVATSLYDIAPYEDKEIFVKLLAYENQPSYYVPLAQPGFLSTSALVINSKLWRDLDVSQQFVQFVLNLPTSTYRSCTLAQLLHYYLYTRLSTKIYLLPSAFNLYKLYTPNTVAATIPPTHSSWVRMQVTDSYAHEDKLDRQTIRILSLNSGRWAKPLVYRKPFHALIDSIADAAQVPINLQSLPYRYCEARMQLEEHLRFVRLYLPRLIMVIVVMLLGMLSSTLLLLIIFLIISLVRRAM